MKPARFEYRRPRSLDEALALLARHGNDAAILAGGQSLIPMLNLRLARPSVLIDIKRLVGLGGIVLEGNRVVCGPLLRHADALRSPLIDTHVPSLAEALRHVAHPAIRNRGTMGGSLALADPAAELPAVSICLGAVIVGASARGERRIAAADFFRGIYATALAEDEIVVRIEWPALAPGWICRFDEIARRSGDFAVAGLAFAAHIENDAILECRIAFCGVEAAPRRAVRAEASLRGMAIGSIAAPAAVDAAMAALAEDLDPLGSDDYPADYRRHLAAVLLRRSVARLQRQGGAR